MKLLARIILFILAFNFNVSLKAKAHIIEYPKNCLNTEAQTCAMKALFKSANVTTELIKIDFSTDSFLIQNNEGYRLVEGTFYIKAFSKNKIDIKFGVVYMNVGDVALFKIEPDRIRISSVAGNLAYEMLDNEKHILPMGYSNWLTGPDETGKSRVGLPSSIQATQFIEDLNLMTQLSREDIYSTLKMLKPHWEKAKEETGARYFASVQVTLKNEEKMKIQKANAAKQDELERKKIRDLFFKKTFLE